MKNEEVEEMEKKREKIEAEIKWLEKIANEFIDERKKGNFDGIEFDELQVNVEKAFANKHKELQEHKNKYLLMDRK